MLITQNITIKSHSYNRDILEELEKETNCNIMRILYLKNDMKHNAKSYDFRKQAK